MNKIILIGNLGKDPDLKTLESGLKIASFSLAVNKRFKKENTTLWVNCSAFNKTAELIEKYTKKGDKLCVVGELDIQKHNDKYYTNIIVNEIEFLSKMSESNNVPENATDLPEDAEDDLPF